MKETLVCFSVVCFGSWLIMPADTLTVNCTKTLIMGKYGSSVVLPCWLNPETNAEALEIRWYRPGHFQTPILLYKDRKIITDPQEGYGNRSSFTTRDSQSTGLKQGDVSMRLDNLVLSDIGIFHCYVDGEKSYDDNHVIVNFTALGSFPHLSLENHQDSLNLSCSSCGWYPRPRLQWESTNKKEADISPIYSVQENGLFCIHNWVILSSSVSNKISCSVILSEDEKRTVSVVLGAVPVNNCGLWKTLFALVLLCPLALIGFFLYRKYKQEYKKVSTNGPPEDESDRIIIMDLRKYADHSAIMEDLRKNAVTITLDQENCKKGDLHFTTQGDAVRDKVMDAEKYEKCFPYDLCVCGKEKFCSGRAYWEVGLKPAKVPPKKSWLIGVAKAQCIISDEKGDYTHSKGFHFLYSDSENCVRVNTVPEMSFLLNTPLERVGVLLDFDRRELAFYNATDGVCLATMKTNFHGDIVPLFNPGIGDEAPLKIMNPQAQTQNQAGSSAGAQAGDANNV